MNRSGPVLSLPVYALIALHLAITMPLAWILNIWADEASTLYTTEYGFMPAFQNALFDEKQAPLYFWVLSLWREISHSIFFARFFSIICSLLAIKFFFDLARRLFTTNEAVFVTAVFALHPFLIWASLEIRVYSFVILLSVLLLRFFEQGFLSEETAKRSRVLFFIVSIIALYANYYLGFLLVGCFIALVVLRKWKISRSYFGWMIFAGLAFLPLLRGVYAQFTIASVSYRDATSVVEGLQIIWNFFLTFILPTEIFTPENATVVSLFRLWIVRIAIILALILLLKSRRIFDETIVAYGAICFVIPAFFFLSYFFLGPVYLQMRHSAVLFAPAIILGALVVIKVSNSFRSFIAPALAVLLLASFIYSIFSLYPGLVKRGDWERVAEFIKEKEQPRQPIIVFTAFDALALPYYYKGANKILPDEKYFSWEPEAAPGSEESLKKQTDFVISEIPTQSIEMWLVVNEKCLATDACVPLENFVKSNYTIIEEREFYLEKVFLLRRNP